MTLDAASRTARRFSGLPVRHPFLVVPFLFYYWTSAPGIGSSDTALIVDQMRRLDLSTHVNHHNLTLIAGWLFSWLPVADPARAANLTCVFLGGVAVGLFYWLVLDRTSSRLAAAASAACLMVSHSMWWHSTVAEVYAMNAVFVVAALFLLQRLERRHSDRALGGLFFVAGLAIFNHVQMGILAVGACAYLVGHVLLARQRGETGSPLPLLGRCAAAFALGFLPYAVTFAVDVVRRGGFVIAFSTATGGDFRSVMLRGSASAALVDLGYLVVLQFPTPFLLAVGYGVVLVARRWRSSPSLLALATMFFLNTIFFAFYNTWDKFAFLLPSFIILAFGGSFAVERLVDRLRERGAAGAWALAAAALGVCLVLPPALYSRLVSWAGWGGPLARYGNQGSANILNLGEYAANPNKRHYREFEEYVEALFRALPENAVYVDDDGRAFYPVRYFQEYRGWRRDVRAELVNSWGFSGWGLGPEEFARLVRDSHRGGRPLFLVSTQEPFYGLITKTPGIDEFRYRRFPLDGRRWIYRLLTASEEALVEPEPPRDPRVVVETDPEKPGSERRDFGPSDAIYAVLRFEPNGEPFTFHFRWHPPDGDTFESEPVHLPFGCTNGWVALDPRPVVPGSWRVDAVMGGAVLAEAAFTVRQER